MISLRSWSDWTERRLEAVVKDEGLRVGLAGVKRGPMTVTYRLRLLRPGRQDLTRLKSLGPVFSQAVQATVRVIDTPEGILVEVAAPETARKTPPVESLAAVTSGFNRVAVGFDAFKNPVFLDFDRWPHLLTVGPTRRGKTTALSALLYALAIKNPPRRMTFLVMAKKATTWLPFAAAAHCFGVFTTPAEVEAVVDWLVVLLQNRAAEGTRSPRVFAVVDDLANVVSRSPRILDGLGELASMGGEVGLHLLVSTQMTGKQGGLNQALEGNLTARLIFGAADASAGARFAGRSGIGVEAVGIAPGDALLLLDGEARRVATACFDPRLASLLPSGDLGRPWSTASAVSERRQKPQNVPEREERGDTSPRHVFDARDDMGGPGQNGRLQNGPLLDPSHPPSAEERRLLRDLFAELGSKEQVYRAAWGFKNGKVFAWLGEALEEDEADLPGDLGNDSKGQGEESFPNPDFLDLGTEDGRRQFVALQQEGLVRWSSESEVRQ